MIRSLPPLNSVRAFEAAARHLNFSRAAEELGVTQGAISKQVIALEDFIGARVFERRPGGLVLTDAGRSLRDSITPAFEMLAGAFNRYSRRAPRSNTCRISTLGSFAAQFLMCRLSAFEEALPHIELEILTSDRLVDMGREEIDLTIRFGAGEWDGLMAEPLVPGDLVPVCAPRLLGDETQIDAEALLASERRIQVFSNNEWRKWFDAADMTPPGSGRIIVIEDFLVALKALSTGQGVALLPEILVRGDLEAGVLVQISPVTVRWDHTYHLAHPPAAARSPIVREVAEWLKAEVAKAPDEMCPDEARG